MLSLWRELRREHRVQHGAAAAGDEAAAAEDRRDDPEPAVHGREEADEERAESSDGSVLPAAGDRPAVGAGAAGGDGPGPPVLQPAGGRGDEGEGEEPREVLGDRIRRRSAGGPAAGAGADAGGAWGAGGGAFRRHRIP